MSFDGRVALVTGSTRGIGWAVAQALAARGATVIVNGRDAARAQACARELPSPGGAVHEAQGFDVADASAVGVAMREIFGRHGRLDVLVNNAGVMDQAILGMIGAEALQRTFAVNAIGALNVLQGAARLMARSQHAAIVNVSSIVGVVGAPGQTAYASAKASVIGLTRAAAKELAPGVRVNAVAPGMVDTELLHDLAPEILERRIADIGLRRLADPHEVAEAIVWLASDSASYVTGQVLGVDGGMVL
jgi:3-oxoacyl-[acyl-carrier protein] reductase